MGTRFSVLLEKKSTGLSVAAAVFTSVLDFFLRRLRLRLFFAAALGGLAGAEGGGTAVLITEPALMSVVV